MLHTGDVGHVDAAGYLKITDRTKDVIKIGGEWVSSLEIEDILAQHPAVAEVAVIGMLDEKWGERPLALIVAKPGCAEGFGEKALQGYIRDFIDKGFLSKQALLLRAELVEMIDKTSVGKINKQALRAKYLQS